MARRQIREAANDLTRSVRGLEQIVLRLAGVKGRKALILFSSAFSFRPGAEITGVDQAELDALFWAEDARAPQALDTLVRAANAAGVTIYTLHAKGLQSGISATDTGVNEPTGAFAPTLDRLRESGGSIDGLAYLAYRTGGLTAANVNFFTRAAERISEDLSSYYSIGYRAPVARNNEHRPIKVIARNKEYTVRARQGAVERSHETELADRVIASLLSAPKDNALGISAQVLRNDRTGRKRLSVPVDVKIPMAKLAFQSEREGGDLAADLSIFIASADSTGSMSSVAKFDQRVSVKRDQMATLAMKYYTYGMDVDLKTDTAENRFAIGVLDNLSKEVGLVTIDLPPATPKGK